MDTFRCICICDCLCVCKPVCGSCSQFEAVSIESASGPTAKCFNFKWKFKIKITAGPQAQFQFLLFFFAVFFIFEITVSLSAQVLLYTTLGILNTRITIFVITIFTLCGSNFKSGFLESHLNIQFLIFLKSFFYFTQRMCSRSSHRAHQHHSLSWKNFWDIIRYHPVKLDLIYFAWFLENLPFIISTFPPVFVVGGPVSQTLICVVVHRELPGAILACWTVGDHHHHSCQDHLLHSPYHLYHQNPRTSLADNFGRCQTQAAVKSVNEPHSLPQTDCIIFVIAIIIAVFFIVYVWSEGSWVSK